MITPLVLLHRAGTWRRFLALGGARSLCEMADAGLRDMVLVRDDRVGNMVL